MVLKVRHIVVSARKISGMDRNCSKMDQQHVFHFKRNDRQGSHGLEHSKLSPGQPCGHCNTYLAHAAHTGHQLEQLEVFHLFAHLEKINITASVLRFSPLPSDQTKKFMSRKPLLQGFVVLVISTTCTTSKSDVLFYRESVPIICSFLERCLDIRRNTKFLKHTKRHGHGLL